ncbi:hypothetical protein GCM10010277_86190 [Streptomyces longisporoflavus]|nr:hypothetical protein GCM10010277_86190 [Streptomyces longisporoflavus]
MNPNQALQGRQWATPAADRSDRPRAFPVGLVAGGMIPRWPTRLGIGIVPDSPVAGLGPRCFGALVTAVRREGAAHKGPRPNAGPLSPEGRVLLVMAARRVVQAGRALDARWSARGVHLLTSSVP